MKKYLSPALAAVLILLGVALFPPQPPARVPPVSGEPSAAPPTPRLLPAYFSTSEPATVVRVFDGDTIEIAGGERVRYIGMDAPEERYSKKATATNTCFADEAKAANGRLVSGKTVRLVKDVRDRDIYGRLLRYVYVAGTSTEVFVNEELVAEGFAKAAAYPPDVRFKSEFDALEKIARDGRRGLWKACADNSGNPQK